MAERANKSLDGHRQQNSSLPPVLPIRHLQQGLLLMESLNLGLDQSRHLCRKKAINIDVFLC
jgi:hypothetical protein